MLHFDDRELRTIYFLDPQWLAKLMAKVIKPAEGNSHISNGMHLSARLYWNNAYISHIIHDVFLYIGVAAIDDLFPDCEDNSLKKVYITLLEKFDVVQRLQNNCIIIPSLMPERKQYPKPNDSVYPDGIDTDYEPPLRRFWFSNSIPNGFWPRLICRITSDQQIKT